MLANVSSNRTIRGVRQPLGPELVGDTAGRRCRIAEQRSLVSIDTVL
jgi:hypothetical protein